MPPAEAEAVEPSSSTSFILILTGLTGSLFARGGGVRRALCGVKTPLFQMHTSALDGLRNR